MFALGGCLLAPELRWYAPLDPLWTRLVHGRTTTRALVVGGASKALVELLGDRGVQVTIADHEDWAPYVDADVIGMHSWEDLSDLPVSWFDAILLPGGTIHTGGPWRSPGDNWRTDRPTVLRALRRLCADDGRVLADSATGVTMGRQYLIATAGDRTSSRFVFAMLNAEGDEIMLRTSDYDANGVLTAEHLQTQQFVDTGGVLDAQVGPVTQLCAA